jgi:class 3 adenylate cyclase
MTDVPEPSAAVERRIVSVLFADLVGFTPLSERLDPEDVATVQDAYFASVRETVQRYGGVLEKFIGDAAMAVFGVPRAHDDDAERAVRAGLALIGAVERLGARLGLEPGELQLRVGVNSGEVVHATSGPDAGRVTGDTVNTAARFQAAADPGTVLIGELTALAVAEAIETESRGGIELKGKAQPVPAWRATTVRAHPSREEALGRLRAPMLGRDGELGRLRTTAERCAVQASAHRLTVIAPPGVGKSRLLTEFAAGSSMPVRRARVRPQGTAPYETVAQLFDTDALARLPGALADAGVPAARASVVEAEVRGLLSSGSAASGSTGTADLATERDLRFDAWLEALDLLAGGASVWLVEDVHWAGADLLAFLDRAGFAPGPHGRLVIATARPSLLETAPEWCAGDRLELAPLPATDAAALVTALVGDALPAELVATAVERSDGTPLFIEELIRTWVSVGTLTPVGDGGPWRLTVQPDAVPMPQTVQAIYAAQLDDLPPDARTVARRGAVAGRRIPVRALEALEVGDAATGVDALRRRAFVAGPTDDPVTGAAYAYRHALLRDAGYASLARAERARLHLAMASWLETVAGERVDVVAEAIAEHLADALEARPALASGLPEPAELAARAAAWYERAAEAALGLSAHEAAERLFGRALQLTDAEEARLDRARRRLRRGEVLAASADLAAGIGELEVALEEFGDDAAGVARAAYALGRAYMQQIRFPEAEALTAATLARLEGSPATLLARLHALHAWAVGAQGRSEGVVEEAAAAELVARESGDRVLELEVLEHAGAARDEVDVATPADWERIEELARDLGRWPQVASAARVRAVYLAAEDPAAALPGLARAIEVASAHGLREQAGWAEYSRAEALWLLDRCDEATSAGLRALEVAERFAYERLAFRTYVILLAMAAERRDAQVVDRWERWWAIAEPHFPAVYSAYAVVLHAAIGAWCAQARDEPPAEPDASVVDAIIPMINPHYLAAAETVIGTWASVGRGDLVAAAADRWRPIALDADATPLLRATAALARAHAGDPAAAREAAELAASIPAPWWERRALGVASGRT